MKMGRSRSELWRQKNWLLHHDDAPSHILFHQGILDQNQHDCRPHSLYFYLFPRLKTKLKGRHFDTIEVIEAESQAVLNTLTDHDFQDAFKNSRSVGSSAYALKGTTSRVMVASRSKVSF
jgi:hypothetical protein